MPEIIKISHGLTIGDLKYGNARPGVVEATLKPGETMEQALDELDERLNAWHRKRYPHLYQDDYGVSNPPTAPISYTKESIISPVVQVEFRNGQQDTLDGIKASQTLEDLSTYRKLSSNNKELYDAYCLRLKQLTHADQTGDTR